MSAKDSPQNDLLDWTMTAAPTAEEGAEAPAPLPTAHPAGHPHHPHHFTRWMWLTLGGLTVAVILGLLVFSWGNQRRVAADVRRLFVTEEEAALTGNLNRLADSTAPGYTDWLNTRLTLAQKNAPAPAPALLFNPSPQAGDIISLTSFAPDIMQADILRTYTGPEGENTRFTTTQFYQYQEGWKRTPTPPYFSGELRQFEGRRLSIIHFERDAHLINTLGPYLDNILESACVEWNCADNFNLSLQFLEDTPSFDPRPETSPEPLIFRLLAYTDTIWLDGAPLGLPAPHIVGTPADDASRAAFQRVLGQQVLLYAAQRLVADGDEATRNALAYALVARLAVRLKLEPAARLNVAQATVATDLQALWDLRAASRWENQPQRQMAFHSALAVLNVILQDQPLAIEQALFQQLRRRNNPRGWLADGLGMEYADVQAALARAGRTTLGAQLPPGAEPTLALQCVSGPQLYFESENRTLPFITGPFLDARISGWPWLFTGNAVWSPNGNYLLLNVSGETAVLNLAQGSLSWLGVSGNEFALLPRGWVSDTVVAYLAESEVRFVDVTQPEKLLPGFPATDYELSPNGDRAVLVWNPTEGLSNGLITVLATGRDELLAVDAGFRPVWIEQGASLMYGQFHQEVGQTTTRLRRADIVNGIRYTVAEGDSMWSIVAHHNTTFDDIWTANQMQTNLITPGQVLIIPIQDSENQVVITRDILTVNNSIFPNWGYIADLIGSPDGERLAMVLAESPIEAPHGLLLINTAGSLNGEIFATLLDTGVGNPQRLVRANPEDSRLQLITAGFILPPRFSADGNFLALVTDEDDRPTLKVYATDSGQLVFAQPNPTSFAWSATGQRLAVTTDTGTFIVDDVWSASRSNIVVTQEVCDGVWWRP